MYAVGEISRRRSVTGHRMVTIYDGEWRDWCLANTKDMPDNHPDFGLFEYDPQDQFCRWVDATKLSPDRR